MWVWHAFPGLEEPKAQKQFFDFVAAPKGDASHQISVVFAGSLSLDDLNDPAKVAAVKLFVSAVHQHHLRVDFLCGKPEYALPDGGQDEGLQVLKSVLKYNAETSSENAFDGLQYDVEPYALAGWPNPEIRNGLVSLLKRADELIRASHQKFLIGLAIPRWYDRQDLNDLYKKVIDATDYVAVMDYVHTAKAFVEDADNEVVYGTKAGKKVWLGAETQALPTEMTATFFGFGNAVMESAFAAATEKFGAMSGFAGLAIHYYEPYRYLKP
jgi:hypothetical protein